AADFRRERIQLVDHRVDGVLQLENLAFDVDRDLSREIAARDGGCDVGDVAHLPGQVRCHRVDGVSQVLPGAGDAGHDRLSAELALGDALALYAGHFRREGVQLVDHRVDRVLQLENLAFDVDRDLSGQIAAGDGGRDFRDIADLSGQVRAHGVD